MDHETREWIEVIRVRSATADLQELAQRLLASFDETRTEDDPTDLRIYLDPRVGTDLCVHLHLRAEGDGVPVCDAGERLARALEDHGLVDRTLWVEARRSER